MPDKYEEEIDEILRQAGELTSGNGGARRQPGFLSVIWLQVKRSLGGRALSISPGRVMLAAVVLLLTALVMGISLIAWAGLILFIVGYAMFFVRPKTGYGEEKRWRGQPIDYGEQPWWERVRRRFQR